MKKLINFSLVILLSLLSQSSWAIEAEDQIINSENSYSYLNSEDDEENDFLLNFQEKSNETNEPSNDASAESFEEIVLEPENQQESNYIWLQNEDEDISLFSLDSASDKAPKKNSWAKTALKTVIGKPSRDAILLGMWSLHAFNPKRDERNETNNIIGIQYKGFTAGTFKNSFYRQSVFAGVSRNVYTKELFFDDLDWELGYKAGLLYGYGDRYPNLFGISPLIFPTTGFSYKLFGVDFSYFPPKVFAVNCRINIGGLKFRKPKARRRKNY